jgi:anti-sigma regulatory factor (Ser/Thr protein kinase)
MPTAPITVNPQPDNSYGKIDYPTPPLRIVLPAIPEAVAVARHLVRSLIGEDHLAVDSIVLCVSELVTNAVEHSVSKAHDVALTLCMHAGHEGVVIQVRDAGGPTGPQIANDLEPEAEHGYGLRLVNALADCWGSSSTSDGRVTWCRFNGNEVCNRQ